MNEMNQDYKFSYNHLITEEPLFYLVIFYMVIFQGHTYKYVAKIFNISCEAVRLIIKKIGSKVYTLATGEEISYDNSNKKSENK